MMTTIAIFGGSGFIGSELSNLFAERKIFNRILTVGRSSNPKYPLNQNVEYIQGDAIDSAFVSRILEKSEIVIDLSYSTVPKTSFENPLLEATFNLPACLNLMQQSVNHHIKRYLLVSSGGTVYGNIQNDIVNEQSYTKPISPYGISKLMMEKYAFFYYQNFGLPVIIARPSNPFGINQIGDRPQGFIGNAISKLISGLVVNIYGEKGTVRDYIYIDDLSRGLTDCLIHGKLGEIYNIGTGIGTDNLEVLSLIENVFGLKFRSINKLSERSFDVNINVLDCTKLKLLSGWQPEHSILSGLKNIKELMK
jgi:UDP-glucose 4-epimerase